MSFKETGGIGAAGEGKAVRVVEGQWAPTLVSAVTEAVVLGEVMPLGMDVQKGGVGLWGTGYTNRYMLCHVCLTSADIYALSKIKCTENWAGGSI